MLVLSRKTNERIVLTQCNGSEIEVVVLACHGGKVRIGIEADRDVVVLRGELADQSREAA